MSWRQRRATRRRPSRRTSRRCATRVWWRPVAGDGTPSSSLATIAGASSVMRAWRVSARRPNRPTHAGPQSQAPDRRNTRVAARTASAFGCRYLSSGTLAVDRLAQAHAEAKNKGFDGTRNTSVERLRIVPRRALGYRRCMSRVVGIDWATDPKNRALVVLELADDFRSCRVARVAERVEDAAAVSACTDRDHAVVAIDIPFGWPAQFVRFVSNWSPTATASGPPPPDEFRFRLTDRTVRDEGPKKLPLPVSADRIAMGARAWAALVATHAFAKHIDTLGKLCADSPTVIEIYPGASARVFGRPIEQEPPEAEPSYKGSDMIRGRLVAHVASLFSVDLNGSLDQLVSKGEDSDKTDAFLAAITAAIYFADCQGTSLAHTGWRIRRPRVPNEIEAAASEGWIFFPIRP